MGNQQKTVAENYSIKTENEALKARIVELEAKYGSACKAYYNMKKLAESKDRTIERLEGKILSLVNDYV